MKSIFLFVALPAIVLGLMPAVRAQDAARDSAVAAEIRGLEKSWAAAQHHRDNAALDGLLDNSVVLVDPEGKVETKADYLVEVRTPGAQLLEETIETMMIHVAGNTAVAIAVYRERGIDGAHPYVVRRRFIDTWAYKAGRWVCVAGAARTIHTDSAH